MRACIDACLLGLAMAGMPVYAADRPAGQWDCQSGLGPAVLEFRDSRMLIYGGQPMQYRFQGNAIQVLLDGLPATYPYVLQADKLDITSPEGDPIHCVRAGTGSAEARTPPAGGGGLNHLLQGRMCAWSGSSSSGSNYSTTRKVTFDGRGRFATGAESSFSVTNRDSGGNETSSASGYGSGPGEGGAYEVTAATPGAPIRIRWNTGEDDVAFVHHVASGRIMEVKYGKLLFAAALCE